MIVLVPASIFAQSRSYNRGGERRARSDGFYLLLGGTNGPSFTDFFSYINNQYQPAKRMKNFGSNVSFNIGYISRFHRNFAIDVGFSIYGLKSTGNFPDTGSVIPESTLRHELDYQAAIFTGTLPIYLEFGPNQRIIPYVGIGISIYSMRLDDYVDIYSGNNLVFSDALRDTRTAVGGHFEAGIDYKINRRLWIDLRGRWHNGTGHLATLEKDLTDFSIKQNIAQYGIGINYYFR